MLTQLSRLSVEADGRYAEARELNFLNKYLGTVDLRLSAYQKLNAHAQEIISKLEQKLRSIDPNLLVNAKGDFTDIWKNDIEMLLRYAAACLLFDDPEHLREGLLLWHQTITKSYNFERTCKTAFDLIPEVVKEYLTEQEFTLVLPILRLDQMLLS